MLNRSIRCILAVALGLSITPASFAVVVNLTADTDVDIRSEAAQNDAFNRTSLSIGAYSADPDFGISRKAYVRFLLPADFDFGTATSANFEMTRIAVGPWAWKYYVSGLNDGHSGELFNGSENAPPGITWNNAPGNDPTKTGAPNAFLASETTQIGNWQVIKPGAGGVVGDKYSVSGSNLVNYINADTNGLVTLMIAREGVSTASDGWASSENGTYDGPALTLDYTPIVVDWAASASQRWDAWRQNRNGELPIASWSYFNRYSGSVAEYQTYAGAGLTMASVPRFVATTPSDTQYNNAVTAGVDVLIGKFENLHENGGELLKAIEYNNALDTNVIGYMLEDEPEPDQFAQLAEAHKYIYRYDQRDAMPIVSLLPNYAWDATRQATYGVDYGGYVQQYIDDVNPSVLTHTNYPTLSDGSDRPDYYSNLELFRDKGLANDIGVFGFVLNTEHGPYRAPSESDIRWQAYSQLAYGAKGLYYYNYRIGDVGFGDGLVDDATGLPTGSYTDVADSNADIQLIADKLMALKSVGVYHTGASVPADTTQYDAANILIDSVIDEFFNDDYIIGEFFNQDNPGDTDSYVMLVNKRHGMGLASNDVSLIDTAQFTMDAGFGSVFAYDPFTGIESELFSSDGVNIGGTLYDGVFSILLNGGQGILLRIEAGLLEGDLNGDGFVGIADLNIVLGAWNQSIPPGDPLADPSGDGFVGIADLNVVLGNWNAGTPPADAATIPEPTTLVLIALGCLTVLRRRSC